MTKILSIILSISMIFFIHGCKQTDVQVIENTNTNTLTNNIETTTNNIPLKAFTKENYIWESWFFSTNTVERIK